MSIRRSWHAVTFGLLAAACLPAQAGSWSEDQFHDAHPGAPYDANANRQQAIYSFSANTYPDGWAALKAAPSLDAPRLAKIPEGTLFLVVDRVPGWARVRFKSGETGWMAARLIGCCRLASH